MFVRKKTMMKNNFDLLMQETISLAMNAIQCNKKNEKYYEKIYGERLDHTVSIACSFFDKNLITHKQYKRIYSAHFVYVDYNKKSMENENDKTRK